MSKKLAGRIYQINHQQLKSRVDKINQLIKSDQNGDHFEIIKQLINRLGSKAKLSVLLPAIRPSGIKVGPKVALVGNSRCLLNFHRGKLIDQHDQVVRFNWALVEGFESHVGSKQTIRVTSMGALKGKSHPRHPEGLIPNYGLYQQIHHHQIIIFDGKRTPNPNQIRKVATEHGVDIQTNQFYGIKWKLSLFNRILDVLNCPYTLEMDPQVGLGITLLCCLLGVRVSLFGFDTSYHDYNYGYYWTSIKHQQLSPHHDHQIEHEILKWLHYQRLIRIYP